MSQTALKDRQAQAVDLLNNPDNYLFEDYLVVLQETDNLYYNEEESYLTDSEYDAIRLMAERLNPAHVYFTGVGSQVRGGKVKLPFEMGSLNQVEIGSIEQWIKDNNLQNEELVISDKMDGTSAMSLYGDLGKPQIAYSRGNGTHGADISRHIFKIANVPGQVTGAMTVRAEVELTQTAFKTLHDAGIRQRNGKPYKNARNMVAGLMNSKTRPAIVYSNITVVAYQVLGREDLNKVDQFKLLKAEGFQVAGYSVIKGRDIDDSMLASFLQMRKDNLDYEIDGLVIDVNCAKKRAKMNPTRDTLNPDYSIKYKVADASNMAIATVVRVEWNVSKHGYLKPRVQIEPTDLVGVTIQHATGFNAAFIYNNGIGPGATIQITRSGDVIPFIQRVIKRAEADMPTEEFTWTTNADGENVDAVLADHTGVDEIVIQQMTDFFMSIDAPHLREGNVVKMFEAGFTTPQDIINASKQELVSVIGSNGVKIYNGLRKVLGGIETWKLVGSTTFFGRGVGRRKFKKLFAGIGLINIEELTSVTKAQIVAVDGFEAKTAAKIVSGIGPFMKFWDSIKPHVALITAVQTGSSMENQKVVFTGFRDKEMQERVEQQGGTMQTGVSGKTTILVTKTPTSTSGKVKKARDLGVTIMGIDEFKEALG